MNKLKKATNIALIVGAGLISSGCNYENEDYVIGATINGEKITFESSRNFFFSYHVTNKLTVETDSAKVIFTDDYWNDFEIESVEFIKGNESYLYKKEGSVFGNSILLGAQKKFDEYLKKIEVYKTKKAKEVMKF